MNIITADWETLFSDDYTLSKQTTESYVRDPRFEAHGLGVRTHEGQLIWIAQPDKRTLVDAFDWDNSAVLCHHANFDGLIFSHHYGITPGRWLCTYSMAQFIFGPEQSKSLGALAKRFDLPEKSVPYDLVKGKHYADMDRETQRALADGCLRDCEITYSLFTRMMSGDY